MHKLTDMMPSLVLKSIPAPAKSKWCISKESPSGFLFSYHAPLKMQTKGFAPANTYIQFFRSKADA